MMDNAGVLCPSISGLQKRFDSLEMLSAEDQRIVQSYYLDSVWNICDQPVVRPWRQTSVV